MAMQKPYSYNKNIYLIIIIRISLYVSKNIQNRFKISKIFY